MDKRHCYAIIARLFKTARMAQERPEGVSVSEVIQAIKTPYRTAYRDFEALEDIGLGEIDRTSSPMRLKRPSSGQRLTLFLADWGEDS